MLNGSELKIKRKFYRVSEIKKNLLASWAHSHRALCSQVLERLARVPKYL